MEHELRLVRSAILYADQITLISPGAEMLGSVAQLGNSSPDALMELVRGLVDSGVFGEKSVPPEVWPLLQMVSQPEGAALASEILATDVSPQAQEALHALDELREGFAGAQTELHDKVSDMLDGAGVAEFGPALDSGLVRIDSALWDLNNAQNGWDDLGVRYAEVLAGLLRDPRSRLLLDEEMGSLARAMIAEGRVQPARLGVVQALQAGVGTGMLTRLPAFPQAPLDELLDVRNQLHPHLSRYRRVTAEFGDRIQAGPFDADLAAELDNLYATQVEPALDELREESSQHGFFREAARILATDVQTLVTGSIGPVMALAAADYAGLEGALAVATTAAPLALTAAQVSGRAALERSARERELKRHDLYYLYQVRQNVGGR